MAPELPQWIVPLIVIFGTRSPAVIIALMIYLHRITGQGMKQMESRLESRMGRLEARVRDYMKRLDDRVGRLEHGQAKLEGLLEDLREAITRQPAA